MDHRQGRSSLSAFSNPMVVNSFIGVLSGVEILAAILFVLCLAWTFYVRISNDFKKLMPVKTLKLNM